MPYHLAAGRNQERLSAADVLGADRRQVPTLVPVAAPDMAEHSDGDDALEARLSELSGKAAPFEAQHGIAAVRFRQHVVLEGRVKALRVQPWSGVATLEATLADETGAIQVVFLGRRTIAGLEAGKRIRVEGVVAQHRGRLALLNPSYRLLGDR